MCLGQRANRKEQMPSLIDLCTARTRKEVCVYGPQGLLQSTKQVTSILNGAQNLKFTGFCYATLNWSSFIHFSENNTRLRKRGLSIDLDIHNSKIPSSESISLWKLVFTRMNINF